jgi:hypothetical protein
VQQLGGGIHTDVNVYSSSLNHVKGSTFIDMMMALHVVIVIVELLVIFWNIWFEVLVKLQGWISAKQREFRASNFFSTQKK